MSSSNGHRHFKVVVSGKITQEIKAIAEAGDGKIIEALRTIFQRLRSEPFDFGEPLYDLKHLDLQVRMGIHQPCVVIFALNVQARRVFISKFLVLTRP